jgi:diaminobutyrate-2-oxoglutarate transaminase
VALNNVTFMPYPVNSAGLSIMSPEDNIRFVESALIDSHSGIDQPAAILLETVQGEGGVNVAPIWWLQELRRLCDHHGILMICDDVQVGCGRTGPFFSFERANIKPDIVTLSKAISGYGSPMALLLIRRALDIWQPGEHNGTFRGYQLAMIGATAALELRERLNLEAAVQRKGTIVRSFLEENVASLDENIEIRGIGLIWGIDLSGCRKSEGLADLVSKKCFDLGLVAETAGRKDSVLKLLPPLTIEASVLQEGCEIIRAAIASTLASEDRPVRRASA